MDDTWKEASEIEEIRQIEIKINVSGRIITRLLYHHELDGFRRTSWSFQEMKESRKEILLRKSLKPNGYHVFINPASTKINI